jgi:pyrimidine deaminase RibD-like protein
MYIYILGATAYVSLERCNHYIYILICIYTLIPDPTP